MDFYVSDGVDADTDLDKLDGHAFGAICPNVKIGGSSTGTLEVTYYESNQPKVAISGGSGSAADLILGTNMSTLTKATTGVLGKTAATPTWDTANGVYTNVLPQSVDNTTNLKLKCDYTLWNSVTGETIEVKGATAEIPSKYLQWKSNFKYTYLFKISDNTNGSTGQGVTGLYPITFDAVEMVNGDGYAEYITTVSEPSITTFGVSGGKYIADHHGNNSEMYYDYPAGTDIYATITESSGGAVIPILGTNVNVYVATTTDAENFPITEASVAESIANSSASPKVTCTLINTDATTYFTAAPVQATEVPREDGGCISTSVNLDSAPDGWSTGYYTDERCTIDAPSTFAIGTYYQKWTNALKLTGVKNPNVPTYYVLEYINGSDKTYKVIKVVAGS